MLGSVRPVGQVFLDQEPGLFCAPGESHASGVALNLCGRMAESVIKAGRKLSGLTDTIGPHPFSQDFRNHDAAIGLLAVLEKGNEGSRDGNSGPV